MKGRGEAGPEGQAKFVVRAEDGEDSQHGLPPTVIFVATIQVDNLKEAGERLGVVAGGGRPRGERPEGGHVVGVRGQGVGRLHAAGQGSGLLDELQTFEEGVGLTSFLAPRGESFEQFAGGALLAPFQQQPGQPQPGSRVAGLGLQGLPEEGFRSRRITGIEPFPGLGYQVIGARGDGPGQEIAD